MKQSKNKDNKTGKKTGEELVSALLVFLIFLLSHQSQEKIKNKMTDDIFDKYVLLFENLLLIHNWVSKEEHSKHENRILSIYLPMFMDT